MIFCNHLAKLLQKIIASQKNQHIHCYAMIFCNHLAKLLQKIVASQKTQHIHRMAMLPDVSDCARTNPFDHPFVKLLRSW